MKGDARRGERWKVGPDTQMNVVNQPLTGETTHVDVRMKEMRSLVA